MLSRMWRQDAASSRRHRMNSQAELNKLSPQAKHALGSTSPQLAWEELVSQVSEAVEDEYPEAEKVAKSLGWSDPLSDLPALLDDKLTPNPTMAVNLFVQSNPETSLRQVSRDLRPLRALKSILQMLLLNENLQA
jgi:hypothetical protein